MDLARLLGRLNAIGGMQGSVTEAEEKCTKCGCTPCECDDKEKVEEGKGKKPDFFDADNDGNKKEPMSDALDDKEEKVKESALDLLRRHAGIQEAEGTCPMCGKVHEGDCAVDEALNTSKLADTMGVDAQRLRGAVARATAGKQTRSDIMLLSDTFVKLINNPDDTAIQAVANLIKSGNMGGGKPENERPNIVMKQEGNEFSGALKAAKDAGDEEFEVGGKKYKVNECGDMEMSPMTAMSADTGAPAESKDRYTLTITKADGSTLNATTDMPQDIAQLIKLAGIPGTTSVSNTPAPTEKPEGEVEEAYGNTPAQTQEREPRSFGDTKNWGLPGTANAPVRYTPPQQGDNPMKEEVGMFEEYKVFKESK